MEWHRICCAVELSEAAAGVVRQAALLAARTGARLTIVHVDERAPHGPEPLFAPPAKPGRAGLGAGFRLVAWACEAESLGAGPVRTCRLVGRAVDEIPRFVAAEGCDLLVVGAPAGGALRRWLRAARTASLLRHAGCEVLVVPGAPIPARAA